MRFLVDAQLPAALARWLVGQGHEAEHVADCGLDRASDSSIWDYAARNAAVIVTKDQDFARRRVINQDGPQIVWVRLPNTRRRQLIVWFEQAAPRLMQSLDTGEGLIELV